MTARHDGYINRTNRGWIPRTTPTERQLDVLEWWRANGGYSRTDDAAKALGVHPRTILFYCRDLTAMGLMRGEGGGGSRRYYLADVGRDAESDRG